MQVKEVYFTTDISGETSVCKSFDESIDGPDSSKDFLLTV